MVRTLGFQPGNRGSIPLRATMYYTYVLQSKVDGFTYIGSTEDLKKRFGEYNLGKTKSIKHKTPYKLIYYEAYETKKQCRKREIELMKNGFEKEKLYSRIFTKNQIT